MRHGETVENVNHILQGQDDGLLSKNGLEQVKRLARRLSREHFDVIYSSDLGRAANTAKEIAKYHQGTPFHFAEELQERNVGSFAGQKWDEVGWDWNTLPRDVETDESMARRSRAFLDQVYGRYPEGTVLFVSHGGLLNALLASIEGKPATHDNFIPLANTSVTIIEFTEDRGHTIHLLNCVSHME